MKHLLVIFPYLFCSFCNIFCNKLAIEYCHDVVITINCIMLAESRHQDMLLDTSEEGSGQGVVLCRQCAIIMVNSLMVCVSTTHIVLEK